MKRYLPSLAVLALAACSPPSAKGPDAAATPAPAAAPASTAPGGDYKSDPAHTSLNFRISHLGLSNYTARFVKPDIRLHFDPAHPDQSSVVATIDAKSLQTNYPESQKLDFDAQIENQFLAAAQFPTISFKSTKVEQTGPATAKITGDLTLHGVTKPVTLDATFNGGYAAGGMDPSGARIGFSAHGTLKRSDYGIAFGLPAPGTTMGVGDQIDVAIETELSQPGPPAAAPAAK